MKNKTIDTHTKKMEPLDKTCKKLNDKMLSAVNGGFICTLTLGTMGVAAGDGIGALIYNIDQMIYGARKLVKKVSEKSNRLNKSNTYTNK